MASRPSIPEDRMPRRGKNPRPDRNLVRRRNREGRSPEKSSPSPESGPDPSPRSGGSQKTAERSTPALSSSRTTHRQEKALRILRSPLEHPQKRPPRPSAPLPGSSRPCWSSPPMGFPIQRASDPPPPLRRRRQRPPPTLRPPPAMPLPLLTRGAAKRPTQRPTWPEHLLCFCSLLGPQGGGGEMSWSSFYIYSSPPLSSSLRLSSPEHENDANREERGGRGGAHHGQRSTSAQVKGGGWRWRERWKPAVHRTCASLWFSSQSSTGRRWGAPP